MCPSYLCPNSISLENLPWLSGINGHFLFPVSSHMPCLSFLTLTICIIHVLYFSCPPKHHIPWEQESRVLVHCFILGVLHRIWCRRTQSIWNKSWEQTFRFPLYRWGEWRDSTAQKDKKLAQGQKIAIWQTWAQTVVLLSHSCSFEFSSMLVGKSYFYKSTWGSSSLWDLKTCRSCLANE